MKNMDRLSARGKILVAAAIAFLTWSIASPAKADSIRWRTIVGIVQAANVVGNINGGGQPWTTLGGRARVDLAKGQLDFDVQGLVLAGGASIGIGGESVPIYPLILQMNLGSRETYPRPYPRPLCG